MESLYNLKGIKTAVFVTSSDTETRFGIVQRRWSVLWMLYVQNIHDMGWERAIYSVCWFEFITWCHTKTLPGYLDLGSSALERGSSSLGRVHIKSRLINNPSTGVSSSILGRVPAGHLTKSSRSSPARLPIWRVHINTGCTSFGKQVSLCPKTDWEGQKQFWNQWLQSGDLF